MFEDVSNTTPIMLTIVPSYYVHLDDVAEVSKEFNLPVAQFIQAVEALRLQREKRERDQIEACCEVLLSRIVSNLTIMFTVLETRHYEPEIHPTAEGWGK